jgi:hypothetical protein
VDPVAPPSRRRRRRLLRALVAVAAFLVVVPLAAIELAYQIEIARIPERPPAPAPSFPPLVVRSLAVQLFDTPDPEMTPIYPWSPPIAIARVKLGARPRLTPEGLAASEVLRGAEPRVRSHVWRTIDRVVLATWISRHLSAREAICVALSKMFFAPGTVGIAAAARRFFGKSPDDLDAGEIAELVASGAKPSMLLDWPDLRQSRDGLLSKLRAHGVIDEPTMLAAMARDVRRIK